MQKRFLRCPKKFEASWKQSAMSKRDQDATSSEGSPIAKPKSSGAAKVRPIKLVLRSLWSARENPSQDLGYPVNLGNDDKGQGDLTRTRKLVQTTQKSRRRTFSSETTGKCSNFRFLETGRPGGSFALYLHEETCVGRNSLNGISKYEVHEPSVHDEDLPFSTKEVENYRSILNVLNGSIEDKCKEMRNVCGFITESRHPSWT